VSQRNRATKRRVKKKLEKADRVQDMQDRSSRCCPDGDEIELKARKRRHVQKRIFQGEVLSR